MRAIERQRTSIPRKKRVRINVARVAADLLFVAFCAAAIIVAISLLPGFSSEKEADPVFAVTPIEPPVENNVPFTPEVRPEPAEDNVMYDYVIKNARMINPDTLTDMSGINIGIKDGRIAAITRRELKGSKTIDAAGLIACPGFIDIDSYEPNSVGVKYKLADGVTTNLLMHGGSVTTGTWYANWAKNPPLINYGASNFITSIRQRLGYGITAKMTKQSDIDKLVALVEENIKNGALGISMSPEYAPGVQGAEQIALSQLAKKYDLATYYHLRYSTHIGPNNGLKAIQEVIDIARDTGVSTHILHITSTGATYCAPEAFGLIEAAHDEGLDITADIYPYDSWATYLGSQRFSSGWQDRFSLTYSDLQIPNTTETLTAETFAKYKAQNSLVIAKGSIPEEEVRYALQKPYVFIASDTIIEPGMNNHPRGSGTFARLIGKYARDEKVISLMDAIAKATILPTRRLESASDDMKKKGRIEIGADADIVLFDYAKIIDTSSNEKVASYSAGIDYVFVNGKLALDPSKRFDVIAGKPVKNKLASPAQPPETELVSLSLDGSDVSLVTYDIFSDGCKYVSLRASADALDIEYQIRESGAIVFGHARLTLAETGFRVGTTESHLLAEPVIYSSEVYIRVEDLGILTGIDVSGIL